MFCKQSCNDYIIRTIFFMLIVVNKTLQEDELLTSENKSTPKCQSRDQRTYLRYKKDNNCYPANSQGPCNENMILFPHPLNSNFGFCDCFDARSETTLEIEYLNSRNLSHCIPEIRGQVYVPERLRCFSVFDQGPCPEGKWLVLNATYYPICAKNTCPDTSSDSQNPLSPSYTFAVSTSSKCYQTMTVGYCAKSYQLRFTSNHFLPQCRYIASSQESCPTATESQEIRKLRCKPGSRYDYLTKCSTSINPR